MLWLKSILRYYKIEFILFKVTSTGEYIFITELEFRLDNNGSKKNEKQKFSFFNKLCKT